MYRTTYREPPPGSAIHALARMQHRGAILADGKTGDGCGLL
ncbi:hypothetical protein IBK40_28125, partial [Escherichia coli]|nr:hypothetical protein [Escherichia coli]